MINAILKGIFSIITKFINIFLIPINLLISTMLPNFNTMIGYVNNFFDTALTYIGFIMDSLFISSEVISFIILFYTFKLTFPYAVSGVKLIVNWYNKLKV